MLFWIYTTNSRQTAPVTLPIISESSCIANNTNDLVANPGNIRVGATDSDSSNFVVGENVIHTFCVSYTNLADLEAGIISVGEHVIVVSNIGVTKDGVPSTSLSVSIIPSSLSLTGLSESLKKGFPTKNLSTKNLSIFSNPTSTGFVNIKSGSSKVISVAAYDILGKQVINTTINNNTLDVSRLNSGIYF